ncbi:uncharacterized protein LOC113295529 [Papaver somniferum]|uniref:uncharacterized protein LOC113295529 n=1 Tax=Papaver somniferum TaxID=3469 RepID=UPI000E70429C|nr:uncharacterized protein LOC113295529 [Papaver somniferum]
MGCLAEDGRTPRCKYQLTLGELSPPVAEWDGEAKANLVNVVSTTLGSSGGILCFWDSSKIQVIDSLIGPYSITLSCKNLSNSFELVFTGVYAPCANNTEEVKLFWREIEETRRFWDYPWVIGGDFNEIRFTHERSSGEESTIGMRKFISRHHLYDLSLIGAPFTWTNNQVQSIRSRIDRILLCPVWESVYPQATQHAIARPCSYHNPIALVVLVLFFCKKLQLLKHQLRIWSKREYGEVERRLEELEDTAFVKKRQIHDGVLIANELIDSRIRSGKPGFLRKVDFEKAFDHVNWIFLDDMFKLMGFGEK